MSGRRTIAFSLLELVLVLVVMGIALAIVTPSLGGWSRGMKLRVEGDELLAATRFARDRAVTTATPHALVRQADGLGWSVERTDAAATEPARATTESEYTLPFGWRFGIESPDGEPMTRVAFYPDGRGEAAVLRLASDRGETVALVRESVASGFARGRASEALP